MFVYRIEDSCGDGPYRGYVYTQGDWTNEWCKHGNSDHPTRDEDNFKGKMFCDLNEYVFGFETLEQLNLWFSKVELENLKELGFDTYKYKILPKHVIKGKSKTQIMFLKQKSKEIN